MNSRQRRKYEAEKHNANLAEDKARKLLHRKRVHPSKMAMLLAFATMGIEQ